MNLRCLLIDDEPPALKVLQSHIAQVKGMEVVGTCSNAVEAMDLLHRTTVDVMFLDIKMPTIIGTQFLRSLSQPPKVIFVTAYHEYAVEGFELDAVDYLVKPVSFDRFLKAVNRLKRASGQQIIGNESEYKTNPNAFVYLKVERTMQKVFVNELVYIESFKDYVKLFFLSGKYIMVKQPLSAMENLLSAHKFLRVHRSFLVSLDKITGYNSVSVKAGRHDIPVGRLYKQMVHEKLQQQQD